MGLGVFCSNIAISCPCIFLISKPIILSKFLKALKKYCKHVEFLKIPSRGIPKYAVIDRTHTLYTENPEDRNGSYILAPGARNLLSFLKNELGCTIIILSGHGEDNEEHLRDCKQELCEFVDRENIIFHKRYHDRNRQAKQEVIINLQEYGMITPPPKGTRQQWIQNCVAMIGDGDNDTKALEQADIGICVSSSARDYNKSAL